MSVGVSSPFRRSLLSGSPRHENHRLRRGCRVCSLASWGQGGGRRPAMRLAQRQS